VKVLRVGNGEVAIGQGGICRLCMDVESELLRQETARFIE
jgi:hypothetical protein